MNKDKFFIYELAWFVFKDFCGLAKEIFKKIAAKFRR